MLSQKKLIIFIPSIEYGGVEKNLFIISNYLSKKIKNISIITSNTHHRKNFDKKLKIIYPKIKIFQNINRFCKIIVCSFLLFLEIFKNKKITVLSFQANIYAIIICKIFGINIIVRTNSAAYFYKSNFFKEFIFKNVLKDANKIIVNSLELKKEILKRFNILSTCIYNPLNLEKILFLSKKKIKNNFFQKKKVLKVINIGRFTDQKDQISILKAINEIRKKINIKLLIVGQGENKKKLQDYIYDNNLKKIAKIIKFTDNPYNLIRSADLFVLSSKFEGLPNVLLEAIALNKFIISSDCPTGPKEILNNGKGGLLFTAGNYLELAKKILFFRNNYKICLKKKAIAKSGLERFDYKINLNKYLKLVKSELTI
jgi:glycosyltransferase involved in cell wall biosynthesis